MEKPTIFTVCILLSSIMLLSACANKIDSTPNIINPSKNPTVTTTGPISEDRNTDSYTISSDFKKKSTSKNVTINEVEEIIALARDVYSRYDTIVVDEKTIYKPIDVPDLSVKKLETLKTEDQQILDFEKYLSETQYIFITMLTKYLPEENLLIMQGKTSSNISPDYYFLNIDENGYKNSKEAYDKMFENGTPSFDKVANCVYVQRGVIFYYDAKADEKRKLFLTSEEEAILEFISDKRMSRAKDPEYYIKLYGLDTQ